MEIRNVSFEQLRDAAISINAEMRNYRNRSLRDGTQVHNFVLRPLPGCEWRRVSASPFRDKPRHVHAICWHGHRDFFRFLFRVAPQATVKSAFASYNAANFESAFPNTGYRNIGSQMYPVYMADACDCPDSGICG